MRETVRENGDYSDERDGEGGCKVQKVPTLSCIGLLFLGRTTV